MAVFYHITKDLDHDGVFIPRVPMNRQTEEDDSTERISVSTSVEGCLTAIPGGGMNLDMTNIECRGYWQLFKIDTDKLGISDSDIVTADELFKNDFVRDADYSEEHWITVPFTVPKEERSLILLQSWEEEPVDQIPHAIYEIADRDFEGDYLEAYMEIHDEHVPCYVGIRDVSYVTNLVRKGTGVMLYEIEDELRAPLMEFIEQQLPAEIVYSSMDEIELLFKEDVDLTELIRFHSGLIRTKLAVSAV